METDRWTRLQEILLDALEQPAGARDAHLDAICMDASGRPDPALREEVASLLAAHVDADASGAVASPFVEVPAPVAVVPLLDRVGPWMPGELLGTGGMGAVYAAERADGAYQQRVALKMVHPGFSESFRARFLHERTVLARLDHPGIARILDGGVAPDGRPYLAMERVEGEPITLFAKQHKLSVSDRVQLFLQACDAVAYAHQALVVHRDLKPGHIIVEKAGDGEPRVKLLDFGLAKLLDPDYDSVLTGDGPGPITLRYAAPEQFTGAAITTATDVYALGMVLYELLSEHRPYELKDLTAGQAERMVATYVPLPPSRLATPELARSVRGDLDTIVLKALEKDSSRRYLSAEAFADDLARYQKGLPITARPATVGYRARKFVGRNRLGVGSAVLVLTALLGGLALAMWQARIAQVERDRAMMALDQSDRTLDFLRGMIVAGGAEEGDPSTPIGVVLDSAATRVPVDLADVPHVARAVHLTLGGVFRDLGQMAEAEREARRAIALTSEVERGIEYGRALHLLGMALTGQDDYDQAVLVHEEALRYLQAPQNPRQSPAEARFRAAALNTYADVLGEMDGRASEAEAVYRESIAVYQAIGDPNVAMPLNGLAVIYNISGRQEEAVPLLQQVVDALRLQFGRPHYRLGIVLSNLGATLNELGRYDEARPVLREAVEVMAETVGEEHPNAIATRGTYVLHLRAAGDYAEAAREGLATLALSETAFGPEHSLTAFVQNVTGIALCDGDQASEGAALLRASLATRRSVLPEGHWLVSNGESLLGGCLLHLGRHDDAATLLTSGYEGLLATVGPDHVRTKEAQARLAAFHARP